ncbi:hypothetical protein DH09_01230 (plasmid) [Bacillaceae bacterium JMAK1]|nr:hypothetical protein DH09_01230 [Bacillaceae bacterium JMAK1]
MNEQEYKAICNRMAVTQSKQNLIKHYRLMIGDSVDHAIEHIGFSTARQLTRLEVGEVFPTFTEAQKLESYFEVPMDVLFPLPYRTTNERWEHEQVITNYQARTKANWNTEKIPETSRLHNAMTHLDWTEALLGSVKPLLYEVRIFLHWSQKEMAERMGMTVEAIEKMETQRTVDPDVLTTFGRVTQLYIKDLVVAPKYKYMND